MTVDACDGCAAAKPRVHLGNAWLCDRCADRRIAALTGFAELPDPPPPIQRTTPDGRSITLRFRLWRVPTGIEMEVEDASLEPREGFHLAVLGDHDADPEVLAAYIVSRVDEELGRNYLVANRYGDGWRIPDDHDEVRGRLIWNESGSPHHVVVDGRPMTWEELGHALEAYEGWNFRLVLEDPAEDLRPPEIMPPD